MHIKRVLILRQYQSINIFLTLEAETIVRKIDKKDPIHPVKCALEMNMLIALMYNDLPYDYQLIL